MIYDVLRKVDFSQLIVSGNTPIGTPVFVYADHHQTQLIATGVLSSFQGGVGNYRMTKKRCKVRIQSILMGNAKVMFPLNENDTVSNYLGREVLCTMDQLNLRETSEDILSAPRPNAEKERGNMERPDHREPVENVPVFENLTMDLPIGASDVVLPISETRLVGENLTEDAGSIPLPHDSHHSSVELPYIPALGAMFSITRPANEYLTNLTQKETTVKVRTKESRPRRPSRCMSENEVGDVCGREGCPGISCRSRCTTPKDQFVPKESIQVYKRKRPRKDDDNQID